VFTKDYILGIDGLIFITVAASFVRMILPGPVTYYSRFYKLSVILNLAGSIILVLSTGAKLSLRRSAFRRPSPSRKATEDDVIDDISLEEDDSRPHRYDS